jgi:NAD(P)-dependent dehydrogenase (short-subunit alcohol dehydrogenase family)
MPLTEQICVVTGAGRGVGRAVSEALAERGAAVVLVARTEQQLQEVAASIESIGGRALVVPTDVTDPTSVAAVFAETEAALGPPSLLVNNAGTWEQVGPLEEADPEVWWRDVEVCLKGTFLCTRAALPAMRAAGRGRIVNVSSYAAVGPRPYLTAYAAARAAVLRLTDSLAAELHGSGLYAFAITPGFVRTELVRHVIASPNGQRYLPELDRRSDALDPREAGRLVAEIAAGRLDALNGRFLHVLDDVEELLRRLPEITADDLYSLNLRRLPSRE